MIACVDVDYRDAGATAAALLFRDWSDEQPIEEIVIPIERVEPYEPGQFYRRELPCLRALLAAARAKPQTIIIDGYVWLGDEQHPGLGAHLFEAMGREAAIIGVAKTKFAGAGQVEEVRRGTSQNPLYVTAAGLEVSEAARRIREMAGPFRIPTLLRRVDQLCRGRVLPGI
jgi:deoxyribonuclease V